MDETPLPFEYLDGQTYADKESKSVQVKTSRSGWDKWQATLLLAIFANGEPRICPLILFKGAESHDEGRSSHLSRQREEEMSKYDQRVVVKWNKKGYANENILCEWITEMLAPALPEGPRLLALDVAKFHKTERVLNTLRLQNITPLMIPPGCTSLLQPLDIAVNKPLKDLTRDLLDDALDLYRKQQGTDLRDTFDITAVAKRRILITKCVGEAWETFCQEKKNLIVETFRKVGLSLPIDGSCDDELSIKGLNKADLVIGDWRNTGSQDLECEIGMIEDDNEAVDFVDRF